MLLQRNRWPMSLHVASQQMSLVTITRMRPPTLPLLPPMPPFFSAAAALHMAHGYYRTIIMSANASQEHDGTKNTRDAEIARSSWQRPRPGFIAELLAHPVYSLASRINAEYFEAVARRRAVRTRALHWRAVLMSIGVSQRLAVVCRGRLSALLVQKLICSPSEPRHATAVVSRRHFVGLKDSDATCVSTLQGHSSCVLSVAFHPSAPYLATGSGDYTAKLWLLNADCSAATCVSTLQGHSGYVWSVAFHPSAPHLATGSGDRTAKLWR